MASVLVVEDNPDLLEMYEEVLALDGHRVSGAKDLPEAMGALIKEHPAVLVLDLGIPGGIEPLLAAAGSGPRVILASGAHDLPERAAALGAAAYLRKPFLPEQLLDTVDRLVEVR